MTQIGLQPSSHSSSAPCVLSISPSGQDHGELAKMLDPSLTLRNARTLRSGLRSLAKARTAVVLCDCDLRSGSWKNVLEKTANCSTPPHLIVTSRLADEALWAEVLNLGGFDVLAKPFDSEEVRRVVSGAWQNWIRTNKPIRVSKPIQKSFLPAVLKSA